MNTPGVYRLDAPGELSAVHPYLDDGYELADISALLDLGTCHRNGTELHLTRHELRLLKVSADAQSFDHPEAFIRMCLDIAALTPPPGDGPLVLVSMG